MKRPPGQKAEAVERPREQWGTPSRLEARNRELSLLNQLLFSTSRTLATAEILAQVETILAQRLDIPGGAVFLLDSMEPLLHLERSWGMPADFRARFQSCSTELPWLRRVTRKRESVVTLELADDPAFAETGIPAARPGWRIALCLPLLNQRGIEGIICLFGRDAAGFEPEQIRFLETVAGETGILIKNSRLVEQLRASRLRLRRLARRAFDAQEQERRRISRELHDETGQALTALRFTLEMIESDLATGPESLTEELLEDIRRQLRDAIQLSDQTSREIRTLAQDLRPAALENIGLNATLKGYCRDFARRTRLRVAYQGEKTPPLKEGIGICLYRFLQEALTNIAKHAGATRVEVTLSSDARTLSLSVRDNGQGFDMRGERGEPAGSDAGIGLVGMQERIDAAGGRLLIRSKPGQGTRLVAWVPLT